MDQLYDQLPVRQRKNSIVKTFKNRPPGFQPRRAPARVDIIEFLNFLF